MYSGTSLESIFFIFLVFGFSVRLCSLNHRSENWLKFGDKIQLLSIISHAPKNCLEIMCVPQLWAVMVGRLI